MFTWRSFNKMYHNIVVRSYVVLIDKNLEYMWQANESFEYMIENLNLEEAIVAVLFEYNIEKKKGQTWQP